MTSNISTSQLSIGIESQLTSKKMALNDPNHFEIPFPENRFKLIKNRTGRTSILIKVLVKI
jgi:hypothetical protein